jgi:arabinofuranosyltransferase
MINLHQKTKEGVRPYTLSFWLLGFSMVFLISVCLWRNHNFFHDDTYITLRYASHLLAGFGPIWNNQGPRVEGFTSPLHLLLVAGVSTTGVPMTVAARVVNVTAHLTLLIYLYLYLQRRVGSLGAQLGVTLVGASWMFIIWDLGGLDAVLYATLATIGVLVATSGLDAEKDRRSHLLVLGSLILAFGTLARPEGLILLGGVWILALITPGMAVGDKARTLATSIGVAAIILIPVEIFRWTYFHDIAPNTMYAKMGGINRQTLIVSGMIYLARFILTPPYLGILAPAAAVFDWKRRSITGYCAAIWTFIGLNVLFVVVSGGDHMLAYRFWLPTYVLLTIVLIFSLAQNGLLTRPFAGPAICGVLVVSLALQTWSSRLNPGNTDPAARVGQIIGIYIRSHWPKGSTVALNTAGSTPFYADNMQYIDMLGLNDSLIARRKNIPKEGPWTHFVGHLKGDGASVLARKPDFIILGPAEGTTPELHEKVYFIGDYEIGKSPVFRENYQLCTANVSNSVVLTYYQRRDLGYPCPAEKSYR